VFQHFHAGHDVVGAGFAGGECLRGDFFVIYGYTTFKAVKICHAERLARQVDSLHVGAQSGHRFRQDAAAAANIEHPLAGQVRLSIDPVEPDRIQFMQRFEFGVRVPPAMGEIAEFLQFVGIGIGHDGCGLDEFSERVSRINPEYIGRQTGRQNAARTSGCPNPAAKGPMDGESP
jgi:hypothetical protein